MTNKFLTVREVADRLNVSHDTVRRMIGEGAFPGARKMRPEKQTSPYFIPEDEVTNYEAKRESAVPFSSPAAK